MFTNYLIAKSKALDLQKAKASFFVKRPRQRKNQKIFISVVIVWFFQYLCVYYKVNADETVFRGAT
jgi:hypothetical protein